MREKTASRTAIIVAKSQALVGSTPELRRFVNRDADQFTRTALRTAGQGRFLSWLHRPFLRNLLWRLQNLAIPGLALHQVLRKQAIEKRTRAALEDGVAEVIQIGAGLDSLCFRLHREWPGVTFREFDHPATGALKRRVIEQHGGAGNNLSLEATNLCRSDVDTVLAALDPETPRVIIVEGVLMYLTAERVGKLFRQWRSHLGNCSRLLFTFLEGRGFRHQSRLVNRWLKFIGEPFQWHARRNDVIALLKATGWEPPRMEATWLTPGTGEHRIADGEWLAETSVAQPDFSTLPRRTQPV